MRATAMLVVSAVAAAGAIAAVVSGMAQERPTLVRTMARIRREPPVDEFDLDRTVIGRLGRIVATPWTRFPAMVDPRVLHLAGVTAEQHAGRLAASGLLGLVVPLVIVAALQTAGALALGVVVPLAAALATSVLATASVHLHMVERSREVRTDLRHQLSAYLDVVTMLLAANTGHEGALEQAAHAGDGRLFVELRRRMREASTSGRSLVEALHDAGVHFGLVELEQVAATATLSAAEGAPVARTLAAKCATVRSTLATDQEAEARLRTSRLTGPLVGMALIFMALVIYPALGFS
jgi:Flp pilus assembly protein TadB